MIRKGKGMGSSVEKRQKLKHQVLEVLEVLELLH